MNTLRHYTRMSAAMRQLAWTAAVLLALTARGAADGTTAGPRPADNSLVAQSEVWLCAGDRIMELLQPGAEWPFVKQHLSGIKLYIGQLHGKRLETREQTIERLRPLVRFVRAHNLQFAVELGGCLDFSPMDDTAGEWSAQHELAALANFYAAGGRVDYLDLDGPIRRLLHPENRRDGRRFDSIDKAADELVDALKLHRAAHPETKYWLLTNFPNWGWRGDVSYHARGPQRQDYGDYDQVVRIVLEKLRAAEIPLDGVTVDNPYDYLLGEHFSVKLADPKSVDWLARVRSYEDFAREQGLTFNLIVNSQRGGQESDERFFRETLQMVDTCQRAGGRPTRWFVQSWYPHPKQMLPETAPHSMTALVKAVIERVRGDEAPECAVPARAAPIRPIQGDSAEPTGAVRPVRVIENVSYGREAPEAQVLTAFLVRSPRPSPVLMQIISGGWNSAPPRSSDPQAVQSYLDAGLSVVVVAHRPVDSVHWPAPAEDVARAIQYVRSQADAWHIDPARIAVKGRSSGGHVALMVGFGPDRAQPGSDDQVLRRSSRPTCIVAGSAPTDLPRQMRELLQGNDGQEYLRGRLRALLGLGDEDLPVEQLADRLEPLSPFHMVTRDAPPVLLLHPGPADAFWPGDPRLKWDMHTPITGFILAERLKELDVPHELMMVPDDPSGRGGRQVPAEELAFLKRYLELPNDAPRPTAREAIDARKAGPRPKLPRLELEGLPPPEPGRLGVLGFRVRAPWMRGSIEQRFPETIHSSLGLHFIDHRRPDMPPLSMLDPFPAWDRDEVTGEISYSHKDRTGLVFSGRARPYEDQVVLEYRIRNETGGKLHNISAQMCTNLGPSPDFDPKEDVTRTFTWVDGQWTSLADTTPNLARTGRHPWILMQVRGTDYRGPRENPDGWWVADQIADHGIAARVTRDGEHLAAVHWDSVPMVMSNSRIPCLHAGPAGGVSLDPGQEVVWRGTVYLMKNDPDQLLRRYLAARENLEPSDRQPPTDRPATTERSSPADRSAPPVRQVREPADRPAARQQEDGPFQIVRSFPVSEATWAAKVGDLYLVAAQRSVLVYRKTGPAVTDYREVNRIFPGVDGRIENCEIAGQRLYVPASAQGLLAYRLEDLEEPDVQPIARYVGPRRIGAISVAGGRVYAAYREGGLGVFDARTLELLGEGLLETGIGRAGLTAVPGGIVYTTRVPEYGELLVVDARNPGRLSVAGRVRNAAYATHYRFPGSVAGDRMYMPEGNGGVGVYDITAPLQPLLQRRHAAVGDSPPRGARALPGQVRAFAVQDGIGYLVRDREVVAVRIDADGFEELGAVSQSKLSGAGLLDPQAVSVRDGVAAIPTTMEGVRFIDVANAAQPEPLLTIDLPSRFEGLAKVGRMVYATADIDGVWQIDWEADGGPRLSRRIETHPKALPGESLSEDLTLHRNHLYVADGLGLAVIDVSDEDDPRQVFYWDYPYPGGVPDISAGWVEGVGVGGDTLYATLGPAGLATFDISDPASPVWLRTIALDGTWGKDVVVQPRRQLLAYAGREQFAMLDVSDPNEPVLLSSTPVERRRNTAGAVFSPDGNQLVVVQQGMFSIYDVHDPRSPKLVASVEGHGSEDAVFFHDYLLVSGRGAGVGVWRVGPNAAEFTRVQTLPCHFYNSKFWVEGERIFTNSEGIDEIRLKR